MQLSDRVTPIKTIAKKVLRKMYSFWGGVRIGDFIPVDENGFWKGRSSPYRSLKKAAMLFNQMNGKIIIEIGTGLHGKMAGDSILVWSKKTSAKRIVAIDLEQERINEVKRAISKYFNESSNVEAIVGDGIEYLKQFPSKIDLLYLDFWVPDLEDAIPGTGRAEAYREAYNAAKYKMNIHSMVLIDDTDHVHPWKHTLIIPEARKDGYVVLYTGRQTLLKR